MTNLQMQGKPKAASLANVHALLELVGTLKNRPIHLPGLGVFYGPSGFGKSIASTVAAADGDVVVEIKDSWTRKAFLLNVAFELGVPPSKRDWETSRDIGEELAKSGKALLIDEADKLIDKGIIETVRELHMNSSAAIVLVGEEALHKKLQRFERIHNRVLKWVPAMPATLADARQLVALYLTGMEVADDLLIHIVKKSHGVVRRVVVNLESVQTQARREENGRPDLTWWGDRELYTGEAPTRKLS
jgi:DNA transposition AAA+ family ATPase